MRCFKCREQMRHTDTRKYTDGTRAKVWMCPKCPAPYNMELEPERQDHEDLDAIDWYGIYGIPVAHD